jgi:ubiquinone/menaquinone biosynthesis C-methylase UbiE
MSYYTDLRIYARQEYLTPGAAHSVGLIAETCSLSPASRVLEVAFGKGEAACTLAERFGCRVFGVDVHPLAAGYSTAKVRERGLSRLVAFAKGDGKRLPVRSGTFQVSSCIGGPSIVGLESCLQELVRVTKPGGWIAVSDIVWRKKPEAPLGPELQWVADAQPCLAAHEYERLIEENGANVKLTHIYDRSAWEEYYRPMREVIRQTRRDGAGDSEALSWADESEQEIVVEEQLTEQFLDYAFFLGQKREV